MRNRTSSILTSVNVIRGEKTELRTFYSISGDEWSLYGEHKLHKEWLSVNYGIVCAA